MSNKIIKLDNPATGAAIVKHDGNHPFAPVAVYLASLKASGREPMRSGLRKVAALIKRDSTLETFPWASLRYVHLQALRAALIEVYQPRSTNRMLAAVRGVLKQAWHMNLIDTDSYHRAIAVKSVPSRSLPPAGRTLEPEEVGRLLDACQRLDELACKRGQALLCVLYAGGLRREEASGMNVTDYNHADGAVTVIGKGGKHRLTYLQETYRPFVHQWLELRAGQSDGAKQASKKTPAFVRFSKKGATDIRLTKKGVAHAVEAIRLEAGIKPFTPHDLRRSFGTHLLQAGADIFMVQELMGHSDLSTTKIYDRRTEDSKKQAIQKFPTLGIFPKKDK